MEPAYSCWVLKEFTKRSQPLLLLLSTDFWKTPIGFLYKGGYCIELSASVMKRSRQAHKTIFIQHVNRLWNSYLWILSLYEFKICWKISWKKICHKVLSREMLLPSCDLHWFFPVCWSWKSVLGKDFLISFFITPSSKQQLVVLATVGRMPFCKLCFVSTN